ncbi:unnamed protein product, partial [Prorocentrum cordatum]
RAEKVGALGEAWATACIASGQQRQARAGPIETAAAPARPTPPSIRGPSPGSVRGPPAEAAPDVATSERHAGQGWPWSPGAPRRRSAQSARVGAAPKFSGGGAPARGEPKVQAPAPGARQREGQR